MYIDNDFVFFPSVESCSMDSLRNAVKTYVDLDVVGYRHGTVLHVTDERQLLRIAEDIVNFKH